MKIISSGRSGYKSYPDQRKTLRTEEVNRAQGVGGLESHEDPFGLETGERGDVERAEQKSKGLRTARNSAEFILHMFPAHCSTRSSKHLLITEISS